MQRRRGVPPITPSIAEVNEKPPRKPLINVHQALGGGEVADVLLWRKRYGSATVLILGTCLWLSFTWGGCSPVSFIANLMFLLVVMLFFWAKSASLFNRPLPPVPDFEVPENTVDQAATVIREWINRALAVVHQIITCGNLRLLTQVAALLWAISLVGSLFNFITFAYFGFLLVLSLPVFYDKNQADVDECLPLLWVLVLEGYKNLEKSFLNKIPISVHKQRTA